MRQRILFAVFCSLWLLAGSAYAQPIIAEEVDPESAMEQEPEAQKRYTGIKLRGLNKITTKVKTVEAVMGAVTRFGNLEIIPRACWVAPPSQRPEQAALMEVWYWKQGEKPSLVFYGWMFASSPALSSLEHPVYDLTMLECLESLPEEEALPPEEKTTEEEEEKDDMAPDEAAQEEQDT